MVRNPPWTVEEIILATQVLIDNEFRVVGPRHPDVIALSKLLNELTIHPHDVRNDEFRSSSSNDRKLANIRSADPNWQGGLTHGSKEDDYFWRVLGGDEAVLRAEANAVRRKYLQQTIED